VCREGAENLNPQTSTRAAIEEWLHSVWRSPKHPDGVAPKTVRSIYNVMKLTFKFGVKWGHLGENPMAEKRVELPRGSPNGQDNLGN
jgi:hypothetical protein